MNLRNIAVVVLSLASFSFAQTTKPAAEYPALQRKLAEKEAEIQRIKSELSKSQKDFTEYQSDVEKRRTANPLVYTSIGDMKLIITAATVCKIPLDSLGRKGFSNEEYLLVLIKLINSSDSNKRDYTSWRGGVLIDPSGTVSIKDEFGNEYKRISDDIFTKVIGTVSGTISIYPGKAAFDMLVFERPVDKATRMTIRLPHENLGYKGETIVEFPASRVQLIDLPSLAQ